MMDAIHIELFAQMVENEMVMDRTKDIWVNSEEFVQAVMRAGFPSPTAAANITDGRFRMFLKVKGKPDLTGVYYVSGWQDMGTVGLSWDDDQGHVVPRRREAVMATRAKG
ncbi:MAG: hypothetical protein ACUZ8A_04085 [Candidatus Bathyanammoxibius sp.]